MLVKKYRNYSMQDMIIVSIVAWYSSFTPLLPFIANALGDSFKYFGIWYSKVTTSMATVFDTCTVQTFSYGKEQYFSQLLRWDWKNTEVFMLVLQYNLGFWRWEGDQQNFMTAMMCTIIWKCQDYASKVST